MGWDLTNASAFSANPNAVILDGYTPAFLACDQHTLPHFIRRRREEGAPGMIALTVMHFLASVTAKLWVKWFAAPLDVWYDHSPSPLAPRERSSAIGEIPAMLEMLITRPGSTLFALTARSGAQPAVT